MQKAKISATKRGRSAKNFGGKNQNYFNPLRRNPRGFSPGMNVCEDVSASGREPRPSGREGSTNFGFWIVILIFGFWILDLFGCATAPLVTPAKPEGIPGIYHRVERKQTLWKISQLYNVDLDELAAINRIPDTAKIEIGQLLFIPGRQRQESAPVKSGLEDFIWPLKGKVIATFGQTFNNMATKGINIQPIRSSEVVAARSGRVIFAADNFLGYGKTIIIDHGDGFSTVYARNSQVFIKVDDNIEKGMTIAKVGSSGRDKNVYLHFEIRKSHLAQNPYFYLP